GRPDGVRYRGGKFRAAPAHVDDVRAVGAREFDAGDGVRVEPVSGAIEEFAGHDLHPPRDTRHARGVVADRADNPGQVRAVAVVVPGIVITAEGVEAVGLVDGICP